MTKKKDDFDLLSDPLSDEDDLFVEDEESDDSKMDRDLLGIITVTDILMICPGSEKSYIQFIANGCCIQ